jgi:hypothetical protein
MRTKDEVLSNKHRLNRMCFPTKMMIKRTMTEYAAEVSVTFLEWAITEGWQTYDSHETWINLEKNNIVLTTNNLFIKFKEEKGI